MRKKIFSVITSLMMIVLLWFCPINVLQAHAENLDLITDYQIVVNTYEDGSLQLDYHIEWRVLDSESEGPLTWVKIGIPNKFVEEIEARSNCIDSIRYISDNGAYVRIDLDKNYYAGDKVELDFSIHQHRMYQAEEGERVYEFTPGWFDEIYVENLEIYWNKENVSEAYNWDSVENLEGEEYYYWRTYLSEGERYTVKLTYDENVFTAEDDLSLSERDKGFIAICLLFIPIGFVVLILLFHKQIGNKDSYDMNRGMGSVYVRNTSSHSHRSGGSCACACACAGGGRAGCSKKDFYGTKLETKRIRQMLQ